MCQELEKLSNPLMVAKYFVYLEKSLKKGQDGINFKNIQAKKFYKDNQKVFDKFFLLSEKYGINAKRYVSFFVETLKKKKKDVKNDFLCMNTLNQYSDYVQIQAQYEKIYNNVLKSVRNIVDDCLDMGLNDARVYLKKLISENRLAEQVVSGRISQYYLVTIKNIDKLISGMDSLSKVELKNIVERKTKLRSDTQNAFLNMKSQQMSPIKLTNQELNSKIIQKIKTSGDEVTCVHS